MRLSAVCTKIRKSPESVERDIDWRAQLRYVHARYNIASISGFFLRLSTKLPATVLYKKPVLHIHVKSQRRVYKNSRFAFAKRQD